MNYLADGNVIYVSEEPGNERRATMGKRWLVPVSLAVAALIATGCGSSTTSTPNTSGTGSNASAGTSASTLKTTKIGGATVLTDARGFTLYWFVPDTSTTSKCNGQCAQFWPPLKGPAAKGPGVTGTLGTIMRNDGSTQATWNGHPLYTYKGDTAPGQNKGNGLNISGGVWHEAKLAGSSSSTSGGGGYGY
jgi:predicted lipoprotein with Yx(FWY)xxD motif